MSDIIQISFDRKDATIQQATVFTDNRAEIVRALRFSPQVAGRLNSDMSVLLIRCIDRYQFNVENLTTIVQDNSVRANIVHGNGQILSVSSELTSKTIRVEDINDDRKRELSQQSLALSHEIEDINNVRVRNACYYIIRASINIYSHWPSSLKNELFVVNTSPRS